ncbi:peptide chain release factor N(5)-glutamine methyltransferase [Primorskyibacter sp. S187A]|uniref:peptide chain release factor N(5)-glutamine methyltransferase n=1 Tax=Primorskyibacter sp. S187A TaxID=3415130 RepID=UPI003C7D29CC
MHFFALGRSFDVTDDQAQTIETAAGILQDAGIPAARREARMIWAACFDPDDPECGALDDVGRQSRVLHHARARAAGKPMSHITNQRAFYDHTFYVNEAVLDPRPETECLVRAALELPWTTLLDMGTGSGAIAVSLLAARQNARGVACDLSAAALAVAERNAYDIGVAERLTLVQSDWFAAVDGVFDLIVSNPPYIAAEEMAGLACELDHEPRMALTDEADGLSAYRVIARDAGTYLAPGGSVLVEIGPTQADAVSALFSNHGLRDVKVIPDLDGRDRIVAARRG